MSLAVVTLKKGEGRTLKAGGELNPKYPGGVQAQRQRLEAEGHTVAARGRTSLRWFVQGYETKLWAFE